MMNKVYNNRYEIVEELGTGAFSVVYKAKVLEKARKISHENAESATGMQIEDAKAPEPAKAKFTGEVVALKKTEKFDRFPWDGLFHSSRNQNFKRDQLSSKYHKAC